MSQTIRGIALGIVILFAAGCSQQRKYDVLVNNRANEPICVWLTKSSPPYGEGWYPPEEVSLETTGTTPVNGRVIPPGQTGEAVADGKFESDQQAIVRVYRSVNLNQMLSMDRDTPGRLDLPLMAEHADLDITEPNGALKASPHATTRP